MGRVVKIGKRGSLSTVLVDCDGGTVTLTLTHEEIIEYGIMAGIELSDGAVEELSRIAEVCAAKKKALSILSYGDKSEAQLRERLLRSGFSESATDAALEYVLSYGYIDEKRQITSLVTRLALSELRSESFIVAKLTSLGYSESDIGSVIDSLVRSGEIDFAAIGDRLADSLGITDSEEKKILLLKRGFISED